MKQKMLALFLGLVLVLTGVPVSALAAQSGQMSSETLKISDYLDLYDEGAQRAAFAQEKALCLAQNSDSRYSILVPSSSSAQVKELAQSFSDYLNKIIGSYGAFPVVQDSGPVSEPFISLGATAAAADVDMSALRDDGYLVRSAGENIFIRTLDDASLSNGVYGFLEDVLQCMFVREDYDYVPSFPTIYLDELNLVSNPDFAWRKVFQYEVAQNGWYEKLKNNGAVADDIEQNAGWGTWCHSVFTFVDPEIYAESHPEYFVFDESGKPVQLCLSNPEVYPIIEAKMAELMAEQPDKTYWDFSINDNWSYCTCADCAKVLEETGSMMGTMLPVINKLAQKFPDKIISTLAYASNETPPKGMTCEENVNIVLAPIESGQLYSYRFGGSEKAARTKERIEAWGKISSSLLIWDYVVDFKHLLLPYPNFDVQKDNHELYIENNVKAVFHQGSREKNDEMARLRAYILSRQMWDNSINVSEVIAKYLTVTYGAAAPQVAAYMDTMNANLKTEAEDLDLYDTAAMHSGDYLSAANNDTYLQLVNTALENVQDARITGYLEEIKLNVLYAIMQEDNLYYFRKKDAFAEFQTLLARHDIEQPHEVGVTMEEFLSAEYPAVLRTVALKITACVASPVAAAALAAGIVLAVKKRKKSKMVQAHEEV